MGGFHHKYLLMLTCAGVLLAGGVAAADKNHQRVPPLLEKHPSVRPCFVDAMLDGLNAVAVGQADTVITFLGVKSVLQAKNRPEPSAVRDKALASIENREPRESGLRRVGPEYQPGIATATVLKVLAGLLALVVLVILAFSVWNRALRREVGRKALELRESEERFRHYFELANIGFALTSPEKGWLRVNRHLCDMLGYAEAELFGKTWAEMTHPDDLEPDVRQFNRLLAGEIDYYDMDKRFLRKDGGLVYTHLTVSCSRASDRTVQFVIATLEDITDRKEVEALLQESSRKYRELVENANSIILRWGQNGEIAFMNEFGLKFFGYSEAEILGRHVVGTIVPETERTGRDLRPLMERILADPKSFEQNVNENMRRSGERVWISWTNKIVYNTEGRVGEVLSIGSDITARKNAEAELEKYREQLEELVAERTRTLEAKTEDLERSQQALQFLLEDVNEANEKLKELDRLKSLFIASMSHELRTPLNSIIGFTGILLQGLSGPLSAEQQKQLGMVKGSSEHLLALITDIIDLSKIEAGMITVYNEEFDLSDLTREVVRSLGPAAERKGVDLLHEGPRRLPVVSDRRRVRQVLVNLLGNAVKFTERGSVTVSLEELEGSARVSVADTGPGMRPEDLPKLFQQFSQITTADIPKHEGTGLGLYLSKKLVALLGGQIRAESEYGKGSVFSFTIPVGGNQKPESGIQKSE